MFKKCTHEEKHCYGLSNKILYVLLTYAFLLSVVPPIANTTCYTSTNDSTMMFKKYLVKCKSWLCFKIMNFFLKLILSKHLLSTYVAKYRRQNVDEQDKNSAKLNFKIHFSVLWMHIDSFIKYMSTHWRFWYYKYFILFSLIGEYCIYSS